MKLLKFLLCTTIVAGDANLHMSNPCFNVFQTTVNLELCKIDLWTRVSKIFLTAKN